MLVLFIISSLVALLLVAFGTFNVIGVTLMTIVITINHMSFYYYRDKTFHHLSIGQFLGSEYSQLRDFGPVLASVFLALATYYFIHG